MTGTQVIHALASLYFPNEKETRNKQPHHFFLIFYNLSGQFNVHVIVLSYFALRNFGAGRCVPANEMFMEELTLIKWYYVPDIVTGTLMYFYLMYLSRQSYK